jgi:hypothetical protein
MRAISAYWKSNTSCRRSTARSTGESRSSITMKAIESDSASSTDAEESGACSVTSGSGSQGPT